MLTVILKQNAHELEAGASNSQEFKSENQPFVLWRNRVWNKSFTQIQKENVKQFVSVSKKNAAKKKKKRKLKSKLLKKKKMRWKFKVGGLNLVFYW